MKAWAETFKTAVRSLGGVLAFHFPITNLVPWNHWEYSYPLGALHWLRGRQHHFRYLKTMYEIIITLLFTTMQCCHDYFYKDTARKQIIWILKESIHYISCPLCIWQKRYSRWLTEHWMYRFYHYYARCQTHNLKLLTQFSTKWATNVNVNSYTLHFFYKKFTLCKSNSENVSLNLPGSVRQ